MSALEVSSVADPTQIVSIAQQVFSALVDDGEVLVRERGAVLPAADPVVAWVDMTRPGVAAGIRTSVQMDRPQADVLVRALLRLEPQEEVGPEDLADAFGEIANVVGGNLKSLLPEHAVLSLPTVASQGPGAGASRLLVEVTLDWRGCALLISLWELAAV